MNSFTLTAIGNLAKDPEIVTKGDAAFTKLVLIGSDYAGKDERGQTCEMATSMFFTAFDSLGEVIARRCRKGDQLVLQAQVRANNWIDKSGERRYDYSYVIQGFRFGAPGRARREELDSRGDANEIDALEAQV